MPDTTPIDRQPSPSETNHAPQPNLGRAACVIEGQAYASADETTVTHRPQSLYVIDRDGTIAAILTGDDADYHRVREQASAAGILTSLADGQYLLPGFTDLHVHAPQWTQNGAALDEPLERWLNRYTFPTEARFSDPRWAELAHTHLVEALLARGTTSVLYYDTIHRESALGLARICAQHGQRAFVGKVVMDDPEANPEFYREDTDTALAETEAFIEQTDALAASGLGVAGTATSEAPRLIHPVVTPRFIPSCTDRGLEGLGRIAERHHSYVQSHCSESDWEHNTVRERYGRSDTEALDSFGLLTDRTVMHHCVYLSESDADLFARRGASVAHCPVSNAYFADAVAPIRRYRRQGVTVGLGTDISGGYDPSVHGMVRTAALVSRLLASGVDAGLETAMRGGAPQSMLTLDHAFYLATVGGAAALHVNAGAFEVGQLWDAQLIDVHAPGADLPIFEASEDPMVTFQKIMNLATPANIRAVWVQGRLAHGSLS